MRRGERVAPYPERLELRRDDQRAAKAEIALLVSHATPKGVDTFDYLEGVWVTEPRCSLGLAIALRQSLIEIANARAAGVGQQSKMEQVYQYLTGPQFRQRIEAIVEKFSDMQADLAKERKSMTRFWTKRESQIRGVIESTVGIRRPSGHCRKGDAGNRRPRFEVARYKF